METYSDLNIEAGILKNAAKPFKTRKDGAFEVSISEIKTPEDAKQSGRRQGYYTTIAAKRDDVSIKEAQALTLAVIKYFEKTLKYLKLRDGKVLVVGLGNRNMVADALGNFVLKNLKVGKGVHFEVCAVSPSVSGITGIESFEIIKGVAERIQPDIIVAIDSLATYTPTRLCSCLQISTAGIQPGSGVGDPKKLLCREALGVDVIGIGVPFVARGTALAAYYLEQIKKTFKADERAVLQAFQKLHSMYDGLVVTPKDVDLAVAAFGEIIAAALNAVFFKENSRVTG